MKRFPMTPNSVLHPSFALVGWKDLALNRAWTNPFALQSDAYWMAEALLEAMNGFPGASPNPSVGCIIVKNGNELARGFTEPFGGLHAEAKALSKIDKASAKDATMYVTMEPCTHQGKQPPCIDAILPLGLKRIVIAMRDPNPLVQRTGLEALERHGVQVEVGVLENEARALNICFAHQITTKKIPVILKWAQSIEGALADHTGKSQWISSEESRLYTQYLRLRYDAILVGARTVIADAPSLLSRHPLGTPDKQPVRLIYDPNGALSDSLSASVSQAVLEKTFCPAAKSILLTTNSRNSFTDLVEEKGHLVWTLDQQEPLNWDAALTLPALQNFLKKPLGSILVEGGPRLLTQLIKQNRAVGGHVFIAPLFLGGSHRVGENLNADLKDSAFLNLKQSSILGRDILLEWTRQP